MKTVAGLAATLALVGEVAAFWRMPCRSRTGLARIDPIVDPNNVADHVHTFHGSGNIGLASTFEDLVKGCTSCSVTQDMSAYWTPPLYFQYANGTTEIVPQVGGMLAYYLLLLDNLEAFPEGFMMLAGNKNSRNFTGSFPDNDLSSWPVDAKDQFFLQQRAIGYNCLNYDATPEPSLYRHVLPSKEYIDANCKDGIRIELAFPSCGKKGELDSDDHQSHVAYPSLVKEGNCPEGYDVHYPFLFFETIFATAGYAGVDGQFMLSQGDPIGTGYHGDFMMGWESEEFLQNAIDTCTNESGNIEDCALFDIQSDADAATCTFEMPDLVADDHCQGGDGLPVGVPVQWGPEAATAYPVAGRKDVSPSANVQEQPAAYGAAAPETASEYQAALPTLSYSAANTDLDPLAPHPTPSPTTTPVAQPADGKYSTSYSTSGNVVYQIVYKEVDVTVTATSTPEPAVVDAEGHVDVGVGRRHVHKHRRAHR